MDVINSYPGYEWIYDEKTKQYKNMYRGTDVGKGGYVYAEPGIYHNVALLDVASMHPNSMIALNYFGEYTSNFKDLIDARIAIKHGDFDSVRHMFGGRLAKYLEDESSADQLQKALKLPINSSYGLTAATFINPLRDKRNVNNIVALKGALTMRTLQDEVKDIGFDVCHIKTDSIKIPNATKEIIDFVMEFGKKYGYTFEHEATYERMCLVNDAVYIAKYADVETCEKIYGYVPGDNKKHPLEWTATGTQFQVPYVFKTLFSKEPIKFEDMCETKSVSKGALYLDKNEHLPDVSEYEKEFEKAEQKYKKGLLSDTTFESTCVELNDKIEAGHDYHFVGKVGQFCPIKSGCGGAVLYRMQDDKYYAAAGTSGYRWLESAMVKELGKEADIDKTYYKKLVDDAVDAITKYGDFERFVSNDPVPLPKPKEPLFSDFMNIPIDADDEVPFEDLDTPPWNPNDNGKDPSK